MVRIIAGKYRGRRLKTLKGRAVRPTSDRVREAIFSVIGNKVMDAEVLDLFAGTGALGFEALSRGARRVVFVDKSPRVIELIKDHVFALGVEKECEILRMDAKGAIRFLQKTGGSFDIIFLDPPYKKGISEENLKILGEGGLLKTGAMVVAEHEKETVLSDQYGDLNLQSRKIYGSTSVSFYVNA